MSVPTVDLPRIRVQTAASWPATDAGWTDQPRLSPVRGNEGLSQDVGAMVLRCEFGRGTTPDDNVVADLAELSIEGQWIRLLYPDSVSGTVDIGGADHSPLWWGYIDQVSTDYDHQSTAQGGTLSGVQTFQAVGVRGALNLWRLVQDYEVAPGGSGVRNPGPRLVFNETQNRSSSQYTIGGQSVYVFERISGGNWWTAGDAVEYLLAALNAQSASGLTWELGGQASALTYIEQWDCRALTVFESIQRIVNPRRGFGIRVLVEDGTATLVVISLLPAAVTIGSTTIPANPYTVLNPDIEGSASQHASVRVRRSEYDRITVRAMRGAWTALTLVWKTSGGDLAKGWTSSEETAYLAADDEGRKRPEYKHVGRRFILNDNWNLSPSLSPATTGLRHWPVLVASGDSAAVKALYGVGGEDGTRQWADPGGSITDPVPAWTLRITREVPIRAGSAALNSQPVESDLPFLPIRVFTKETSSATEWTDESDQAVAAGTPVLIPTPLDYACGILLQGGPEVANRILDLIDAEGELAFTVGIYEPLPLRKVWVRDDANRPRNMRRALEFVAGGVWEIRILEGTLWSADDTVGEAAATYSISQNVGQLGELLQLAREWYAVPEIEAPITSETLLVDSATEVGILVGDISFKGKTVTVDQPITRRSWDFTGGRTTIDTQRVLPDLSAISG